MRAAGPRENDNPPEEATVRSSAASSFEAVKVTDQVYWVGAIDWGVRDFHGYATDRGSTYNAYLILADKITLIDTVKAPFAGELLSRIASVVDPAKVDYVISNHAEMDHSGALREVLEALNPEKVFASAMGVKALEEHFHLDGHVTGVADGETLSLGSAGLTFVEARMLHWPDSMMTYLAEERLLFSNDAFGMHLASSERFDDELQQWLLEEEAARYFANILLPFSPLIAKLLEKVAGLGIDIDMIATSHGPIWRKGGDRIASLYATWASGERGDTAVVVFDTMWQSTAKMARAIGEGLTAGGARVKLMPLRAAHRSDVAVELLDAGALLVGSPTLNNNMFPTVADVLTYVKGLRPRGLIGAAFGSYGWGGQAVGQIEDILRDMKVDLAADGLKTKYVPDAAALRECRDLGVKIAGKLKGMVKV